MFAHRLLRNVCIQPDNRARKKNLRGAALQTHCSGSLFTFKIMSRPIPSGEGTQPVGQHSTRC